MSPIALFYIFGVIPLIFLTFFIVPLLICVITWIFTKKITWKEAAAQLVVQAVLVGSFVVVILQSNMSDKEVWNGVITNKKRVEVSCSHSYKCHCYTTCSQSCSGSGSSRSCSQSCTEHCQTCYDHRYDVDWEIYSSLKESWDIGRIDRQGLGEPPRWTVAKIGEPTSTAHSYDNFIKGSPDSLFKTGQNDLTYQKKLPKYPISIFDYHRLNRLVRIDHYMTDGDITKWNEGISKISSELGSSKQVNIVVVITELSQDYFQALNKHWLGGKKNDAIPVIGVDKDRNILWVEVMSLSNEEFKVKLRNDLMDTNKLDIDTTLSTIKRVVQESYVRRPMKDFEYLKSSIQPTMGQWIWGMVLSILISIGLSFLFYLYDPFGDEYKIRYRY